jgi:hypothetical protein
VSITAAFLALVFWVRENGLHDFNQVLGIGVVQRQDGQFLSDTHNVDGLDNLLQTLDVGIHIRDNEHVGGRIVEDDAALGHQR